LSKVLRKEVRFAQPPVAVWTALTDPRALAEWLMPNNFAPEVGRVFRFQVDPGPGFSGINECEVLEVNPPRRLVYTWRTLPSNPAKAMPPAMTLTWTLHPDGDGTRLVLEQSGVETLNWWWRFAMNIGWNRMLKTLLPKVLLHVTEAGFTPGAIVRRDYKSTTVPEDFAK
jgi:uncharacterized protein YndB with AHSA1/START domain